MMAEYPPFPSSFPSPDSPDSLSRCSASAPPTLEPMFDLSEPIVASIVCGV